MGAALVALTSCGSDESIAPPETAVTLEAVTSCEQLLQSVEEAVDLELDSGRALLPFRHSDTNVQVLGVDEPDLVKTDGKRIFALAAGKLRSVLASPAERMEAIDDVELAGDPREMFMFGRGRIVVISQLDTEAPKVLVTVVDAANPANLRPVRSFVMQGRYETARRVGSSVRIVLSYDVRRPILWNERPSLREWLPMLETETAEACGSFYVPNLPVAFGVTSIATLDPEALTVQRTNILGRPDAVYANRSSLYLVQSSRGRAMDIIASAQSYVHRLDLRDPERTVPAASGTIPGTVLDRFSLDEYGGFLRMVTTRYATFSRVNVIAERNGVLKVVGAAEIGRGEPVESVRFFGRSAFVAVEGALLALDLSLPERPFEAGSMAFEGEARYLHLIGSGRLLALGIQRPRLDAIELGRRVTMSLFDVRDLAKPRLINGTFVGTSLGWTEALFEPKAFTYHPLTRTVAVPFADADPRAQHYWGGFSSSLHLFTIDPVKGIRRAGAIGMEDMYRVREFNGWSWLYRPMARRGVMIDRYAYAVSDAGMRAASIDDPEHPVATVLFEGVILR
jgi:uncharacterized secreted protein with C-terminal beta-propeller domain